MGAGEIPPSSKLFGLTLLHLKSHSMAPVLGKRKRRGQTDDLAEISGLASENANTTRLQALSRQHFESTFEPLEGPDLQPEKFTRNQTAECLVASESDWDGFSQSEDGEDAKHAVVVQCRSHRFSRPDFPKEELKTFMVRIGPIYWLL